MLIKANPSKANPDFSFPVCGKVFVFGDTTFWPSFTVNTGVVNLVEVVEAKAALLWAWLATPLENATSLESLLLVCITGAGVALALLVCVTGVGVALALLVCGAKASAALRAPLASLKVFSAAVRLVWACLSHQRPELLAHIIELP